MSREELISKQRQILARIAVLEKKQAARRPRQEKANAELIEARKEALRKVEEEHRRRSCKLVKELAEIDQEINLLKKGYVEVSADIVRVGPSAPRAVPAQV